MTHTFGRLAAASAIALSLCTPAAAQIDALRSLLAERGPRQPDEPAFQIVLGGAIESSADVSRWEDLGVTRMIVSPWRRSSEAIDGLRSFADRAFG